MILIAFMFVDVVAINQLSNPLAYARQSFQERFAAPVRELQSESDAAQPPVERLYGPPLTAVGYRNSGLQTRIPTTYGYNPLELVGYAAYENAAATNSRLINGFAANYAVGGDGAIHPLSGARPLAYFAQSVVSADNEATAQNVLLELDPARATLVTGTPPPIQSDPSSTVTVVQHSDDALTIRYASATPNLIRVAVAAFPGWRAQLDGSDLPVLTVDHAFLGVLVPAGAGEVRLVFAPRFFAVSAILSGLALVAAAVVVAASGKIIGLRSKPTARQQYQAATLR
jgi:hypothetical protein